MKRKTKIILFVVLLLLCMAFSALKGALNTVRLTGVGQHLKDIAIAHNFYSNDDHGFPASIQDIADVDIIRLGQKHKLKSTSLVEPYTNEPFMFFIGSNPKIIDSTCEEEVEDGIFLIACMKESVCVEYWPFGERKRLGVFSDCCVRNIIHMKDMLKNK